MATLLLLDSLSCGAHCDSAIASFGCRPDLSSPFSRPPLSPSSSAAGTRVLLESSLFGCTDLKLSVDHIQAAAENSRLHSETTRCALSPSVDILNPLPRISTGSDEAIRPRPAQSVTDTGLQADLDKVTGSAAAGRDFGGVSSPLFLSTSQSSRFSRRRALRNGAAMQLVAATPSQAARDFKGGTGGVFMAFAALILGITAVVQKGGSLGNCHTTICSTCHGYGKIPCFICGARGKVQWEGKLKRADPCPLCFGSCSANCSSCGGIRVYKGVAPFQQRLAQNSGN